MRQARATVTPRAALALAVSLATGLCGCDAHNDPDFNPYAPNNRRASLMESADALNRRLDREVSHIEQRVNSLLE